MRFSLFFLLTVFSLFQISCNNQTKKVPENKTNQPDLKPSSETFSGTFYGITPCADCPGIETTIHFNPDSTFIESLKYMERNSSFSDTGKWIISQKIITVTFSGKNQKKYFLKKSDSSVSILDADKKEIEGPLAEKFILKRKF